MCLLEGLNTQQKDAVVYKEGPMLILAGAGSGKTRVLTYRIAYLVKERGISPWNILAITFTNKAANEMKERLATLLGEKFDQMWVGTFHSICVKILRRDIEKIGFTRDFTIFDAEDQQKIVAECLKELNINEKNFPVRSLLSFIEKAKDELIEPETYEKMYASDFRMKKVASVYSLYQKKLKQNNALDFDDIILFTIKLFLDNPPVLEYYQRKFMYIMVDEYQDTNTAQYHLISLLAQKSRNLCVVGDDDQSIYGWRGANIRNILDFEKEFKDCKVVKLEQNYRSTQTILDAANNVIKNNTGRKSKRLWTENPRGSRIKHYEGTDEHDEALFVAEEIKRLINLEQRKYRDIAVLYRMNAQSRVLEEMLMKEGIPYRIFGGLRFYDRKEIKDVVAYLRVIQNPADSVALKRIINTPRRGIGNATVETAENIANQRNLSIFAVISAASGIPELQRAASKLESFTSMINEFILLKDKVKVSELISKVIDKSGILAELKNENTPEAQSRIENIRELISVALEFENMSEDQGLMAFLAHVSLVTDIDNLEEERDHVVLTTLHSAKGLEFPVVFMVGMEEGVFPGYRSIFSEEELEEERRLCYVGITRAKHKLYFTNTYCRTLFGSTSYNRVSRFLREIPPELMESKSLKESNIFKESDAYAFRKSGEEYKNGSFTLVKGSKPFVLNTASGNGGLDSFKVGDIVEHGKFGTGEIISVESENSNLELEIKFQNYGVKRLLAAYANLKKLK